jgi:hypothetical protein
MLARSMGVYGVAGPRNPVEVLTFFFFFLIGKKDFIKKK